MKSDKLLLPCLTFRLNDYIKNRLNKDLVDPDRGTNLKKKKITQEPLMKWIPISKLTFLSTDLSVVFRYFPEYHSARFGSI